MKRLPNWGTLGGSLCLFVLGLSSAPVMATPLYWDINGTSANVGTTASGAWDGVNTFWNTDSSGTGGSPQAGTTGSDDLFFSSGTGFVDATAVTISGAVSAKSITFQEGSVTLSGGSGITLGSGGLVFSNGTVTNTISSSLILAANTAFTNNDNSAQTISGDVTGAFDLASSGSGAGSVTISGVIGSDVLSLTHSGVNTLILSGASGNTYTGLTTVSNGSLNLNKSSGNAVSGNLTISGGRLLYNAATLSNQIVNSATVTMSSGVFNGTAVNTGTLNINDTIGALTVTGGSYNSGMGSTGIVVTNAASFTGGAGNTIVVLNSGSRTTVGSLSLTAMTASAGGTVATNNSFTLYGNTTTRSKLTVGSGGLALNGSILNLRRGGAGALGSQLALDGDVTTTGSSASGIIEDTAGGTTGTISLDLSATGTGAITRTFTVGGGGADLLVSVPIVNGTAFAHSLAKAGSGTMELTRVNTYTGSTTINGGTLLVSGTGSINSTSAVTVNSGGTLRYDSSTGLSRNVTLAGGTFRHNSSTNYSGTLTFSSGTVAGSNWAGQNLSIGANQTMSPGNSTGAMAAGNTTWANDGTFVFELNNATGTAGSTSQGWDLLNATSLNITSTVGNEFLLQIVSLDSLQSQGQAANFVGSNNYSWLFVDAGATITGFDALKFEINTTGFQNTFTGSFSVIQGTGANDDKLYIAYTTVPEPSSYALLGLGLLMIWILRQGPCTLLKRKNL